MADSIEIHGSCDDRLVPLKDAFRQNFEEGLEFGASLCVTHRGKPVLDLWAGSFDQAGRVPWQEDTVIGVMSVTKIATILCTLMQVDRGLLDLDATVASYWPEFGQAGKDKVTLRHVLTHRAGIPGLKTPVPSRTLGDWDAVIRLIEQEEPWFEPGTVACYHAINLGFILGELIRLTSGKRPREYFHEEVASKIGCDFSIGAWPTTPFRHLGTRFNVEEHPPEEGSIQQRVLQSYSLEPEEPCWDVISRDSPATNGWGNGRSIARFCAIFANGGQLDGIRFLSRNLVEEASSSQYYGEDKLIGTIDYGLGFGLHSGEFAAPTPSAFHWGGAGGLWAVMDLKSGISAGYAMNRCLAPEDTLVDDRQARLWGVLGPIMRSLEE